ncbi:L-type lectin-domain containing receptor kinase VII.1-like isoform X2 [Arachis stenosperma]|uniref:L-type lectin-domain containing receptor kinase VII.1-like isoform X2 n=1 Tax=Arachis stenosperma TaxID=217475 RepID=UPI0025AD962F|nr:L-type lectin-domain containing receptor kinase VII.1-like isoform X2 [Arachis stenosperma]
MISFATITTIMSSLLIYLFLLRITLVSSSTEFVYNTNFSSTNINLYANATIDDHSHSHSSILTLTNHASFSIGRAFYPSKIPTKSSFSSNPLPFSTSFIFSIAPFKHLLPGHGFVFLFSPFEGANGVSSAQHLGLFNLTNNGNPKNHVFGIEFDVFKNQEFNDINDNHVGLDVNSLTSLASHDAGFWVSGKHDEKFKELKLNNGQLVESHKILAWSFSNSNFSIGDALVTTNLPSFVLPKEPVLKSRGFVSGISFGIFIFVIGSAAMVFVVLLKRKRSKRMEEEGDIEDWELEYWPHRISYEDIYAATKAFSEQNIIGFGGNGKVYKGILQGVEVAVKRIPYDSEYGMREFLSEISSLGRLKHRNVVPLRGWCKKERGSLILIYDYMENGSLDKIIFDSDENSIFHWKNRIKVLKDVAMGILYLHESWEVKVLHRDIKASNVLLDKDMNARLGDFGLARMHHHEQIPNTSRVIGTVGYMAPELLRTGRASTQTDVFSFGVLVLEVVCGRRPIEENKPALVGWVWRLMERGELCCALDKRLKMRGDEDYSIDEVERVLHLGLLCTHYDPQVRPSMRQVVKVLEGESLEISLVDKINSAADGYSGVHPTIEDISQCSFTTQCEGR